MIYPKRSNDDLDDVQVRNPWITENFKLDYVIYNSEGSQVLRGYSKHKKKKELLAIKLVNAINPQDYHMLVKQIELMLNLKHNNILPILEYYFDDVRNQVIYVMPYGVSVFSKLQTMKEHNLEEVLWMMLEVASALEYAHQQKSTYHGNLKPENIIIVNGVYRVCDWGMPKLFLDLQSHGVDAYRNFNETYIAPEVVDASIKFMRGGGKKDAAITRWDPAKADLFALALIVLQMFGINYSELQGYNMNPESMYLEFTSKFLERVRAAGGANIAGTVGSLLERDYLQRPSNQDVKKAVLALSLTLDKRNETNTEGHSGETKESLKSFFDRIAESYLNQRYYRVTQLCESIVNSSLEKELIAETDPTIKETIKKTYSLARLAYKQLKDYPKALEFSQLYLKIQRELLTDGHLEIAKSYELVAADFMRLCRYEDAIKNYQTALDLRKKVAGNLDPGTAATYSKLGIAYNYQKELKSALKNHNMAYDIRRRELGDMSKHTNSSYKNVLLTLKLSREYEKLVSFCNSQLPVRRKTFGETSYEVAETHSFLAWAYSGIDQFDLAFFESNQAYDMFTKLKGDKSIEVGMVIVDQGMIHQASGNHQEALKCYQAGVHILSNSNDRWALTALASAMQHSGAIYFNKMELENMLNAYGRAIEAYKILKKMMNDPELAEDFEELDTLHSNHFTDVEIPKLSRVLISCKDFIKDRYGDNYPLLAVVHNKIALAYEMLGKNAEAIMNLEKGLAIEKHHSIRNDAETANSYKNLCSIYEKIGDRSRMINYGIKTMNIYRDIRRAKMTSMGMVRESAVLKPAFKPLKQNTSVELSKFTVIQEPRTPSETLESKFFKNAEKLLERKPQQPLKPLTRKKRMGSVESLAELLQTSKQSPRMVPLLAKSSPRTLAIPFKIASPSNLALPVVKARRHNTMKHQSGPTNENSFFHFPPPRKDASFIPKDTSFSRTETDPNITRARSRGGSVDTGTSFHTSKKQLLGISRFFPGRELDDYLNDK